MKASQIWQDPAFKLETIYPPAVTKGAIKMTQANTIHGSRRVNRLRILAVSAVIGLGSLGQATACVPTAKPIDLVLTLSRVFEVNHSSLPALLELPSSMVTDFERCATAKPVPTWLTWCAVGRFWWNIWCPYDPPVPIRPPNPDYHDD
jgi:hypothetical protein